MADRFFGSICLTTLIEKARNGHSAFSKADNGKVYFDYVEFVNDEPNEYGQHTALLLSSKKERFEQEGKVYIGNGTRSEKKPVTNSDLPNEGWDSGVPAREQKNPNQQNATSITEPIDDLPF
jgi:hypothetical protein